MLQRQAGNRAVAGLVTRAGGPAATVLRHLRDPAAVSRSVGMPVVQRAPGPLTPQQESGAVIFNRGRYDQNSVRVIQVVVGTTVDGDFGPISAQAVATFQGGQGLAQTGLVDQPTLDAVVASAVSTGDQDYAIYAVADFFDLPVRTDTLSLRFDPALAVDSANRFEPGGLRVITIGATAMVSAQAIGDQVVLQFAVPAPAAPVVGPRPDLLTPPQEASAVSFDRSKFSDPRAVRAIQAAVDGGADGIWGSDTVERVAAFQDTAAILVDGKVGPVTLSHLVSQWDANGEQDSAIRAIVDFYDLNEDGLVDVSFDPGETANASTGSNAIPGDSVVRIAPRAFAQGFAGLVHTIAHEFEHVRQRRVGIQDQPLREFLGERIEILSIGMDEEDLTGFMNDAGRAIDEWDNVPAALQRVNFARFEEVRSKVRARLAAASGFERLPHLLTLARYEAVVRP
ncbi:MAG: peptidoglycan-binding domain-containing protein [Ilumatobacteraceae bacterium]